MKLKKHSVDKSHRMDTTTILEGITVIGDIKGSHNLLLNGRFEGTIELTALFFVGKTGKFKGEVKAKYVIIEGEMEGKVMANEKVELRDTGKYKGEILAPSVMISDNAFFDGVVKMLKEGLERPDIPLSKSSPPLSGRKTIRISVRLNPFRAKMPGTTFRPYCHDLLWVQPSMISQ